MSLPVFERLKAKLNEAGISFTVLEHEPVYTSEQAAAVRGTPLASGAKALILNLDSQPSLFVLPADRRVDSRRLRTATNTRSLRFATAEEVLSLTGLRPGSIPPFGSLFGLDTYCDPALSNTETMNSNVVDHSISMSMSYSGFIAAESPRLLKVSTAGSST